MIRRQAYKFRIEPTGEQRRKLQHFMVEEIRLKKNGKQHKRKEKKN